MEPHQMTDSQLRKLLVKARDNYLSRNEKKKFTDSVASHFPEIKRGTVGDYLGSKVWKDCITRPFLVKAVRVFRTEFGEERYGWVLEEIGVVTLEAA